MASSIEMPTLHATTTSTGSFDPQSSTAPGAYVIYSPSSTPIANAYPSNPGNGTNTFEQCMGKLDGALPKMVPPDFDFSGNVPTYYVATEEVL